jgi:hypothetical protein
MSKVADEMGAGAAGLQLPKQVTLAEWSSAGPFGRSVLKVLRVAVPLINGTTAPARVVYVNLSPLADARGAGGAFRKS